MGLHDVWPGDWHVFATVNDWWTDIIHKRAPNRKAMASLAMLVSWEIWLERNARVFRNKSSTSIMLIEKIKNEAAMWCLARAKALSNVMPRE